MATFYVGANAYRPGMQAPVSYVEAVKNEGGSPEVTLLADSSASRRTFQCAYNVWPLFAQYAIGFPQVFQSSVNGQQYISRVTPWLYPGLVNTAGRPYLYVQGMQRLETVSPSGSQSDTTPNSDIATYQLVRPTFSLTTLTFDIAEDPQCINQSGKLQGFPSDAIRNADGSVTAVRYITIWPKQAGRYLTVPNGAMAFMNFGAGPPVLIPGLGLPIYVPSQLVTVTWHQVPAAGLPVQAHQRALGCVNRYTTFGYPKGTLRLDAIDPKPVVSAIGDRCYDAQYTFRFEPNFGLQPSTANTASGHNFVIRNPPNGSFDFVPVSSNGTDYPAPDNLGPTPGTGVPPYRYFDFSLLFQPD